MKLRHAALAAVLAAGCAAAPSASVDDGAVIKTAAPAFAAFVVEDAAALGGWYAEVFGVEVRNDIDLGERGRILILDNQAGVTVELIQLAAAVDPVAAIADVESRSLIRGPFKTGVFVNDVEAAHAAAVAAGLDVDAASFADDALGRETFLMRDPEGNRVQVFGPKR